MLKYFKVVAMLSIIALGVLTVSCQKEDLTSTEKVETSTLNGTADSTFSMPLQVSRDWTELLYNASICYPYTIVNAVKLSDNQFRFAASSTSTYTTEEMYVKFYCHTDNSIEYVKMQCLNPYSSTRVYKLEKTFSRSAKYSYRYFVRQIPTTNYLRQVTQNNGEIYTLVVPDIGNDYPWPNASPSSVDSWGFYKRWCTSWVAWKVNQMWGTEDDFRNGMFGGRLGNAYEWKQNLVNNGYLADQNPQAGDIMWYPASNDLPNGHVAFVHSVNGNTIEYSYYSLNADNNYHTGSTSYIGNKYFIHVQQKQ